MPGYCTKDQCTQGLPGKPGSPGHPGRKGERGRDGVPGVIIFSNANEMNNVRLEGMVAYRSDVKQMFYRDDVTWRALKPSRCGDGILDPGEECDDGNNDYSDFCINCKKSFCGDGFVNRYTEQCDWRNFSDKSCASIYQRMTGRVTCSRHCQIFYGRCHFLNIRT